MESNQEKEALLAEGAETSEQLNNTIDIPRSGTYDFAGGEQSSLSKYTITSYLNAVGVNEFHYMLAMTMGLGNASDATEIIAMNYYISSDDFLRDFGKDLQLDVLTSAIFFGMLLGGVLVGYLGDFMGRRKALIMTLALNTIAGILSALTSSALFLSLCRFVAGVGVGGTVPLIFTLSAEMLPTASRGFFLTLVAAFWMVGSVFTSLLAYILLAILGTSWRVFAVACALPSAVTVLLVVLLIPESPRRLYLLGNYDKTVVVLNKIKNYKPGCFIMCSRKALSDTACVPTLTIENFETGQGNEFSKSNADGMTFLDQSKKIYSSKKSVYLMFLLQSLWFFLSFSNYGLLTWITTIFKSIHLGNPYLDSVIFATGGLPANIVSAYVMDRMGGRLVMIISMGLGSLMLFAFAFEVGYADPQNISLLLVSTASMFNAFATSSWNALDIMSTEIFPTDVRSTVMGYLSATGRVGAIVGQVVNASLIKNPTLLILSSGFIMVLGTIAPLFLPDTRGQHLQETSCEKFSDDELE